MRLWHKDLIPYLPRQQLVGQWRECCAIAKNIAEKGTPNHVLVNRIMDYPLEHFFHYAANVEAEMVRRGYTVNCEKFGKWYMQFPNFKSFPDHDEDYNIFQDWHNNRYLLQCGFNLQEKFDCGAISEKEWEKIEQLLLSRK